MAQFPAEASGKFRQMTRTCEPRALANGAAFDALVADGGLEPKASCSPESPHLAATLKHHAR
jgi:hypothetical protein